MAAVALMFRSTATRVCAATAALLLAAVCGVSAQSAPRSEYEIKAAYLFTFGRFVEWPSRKERDEAPSAASVPFTICVLGTDPFGPALDATIADGTVRGRKAVGRRIVEASEATACHIVFISTSEERRLDAVVRDLARAQVLTVSDIPQFVDRGGMIQFVMAGNKVRFEINLPPARDAGLTMSSELLKVASAVRNNRARGE